MCSAHKSIIDSFDDLEDPSWADSSLPPPVEDTPSEAQVRKQHGGQLISQATVARFPCDRCHGTGEARFGYRTIRKGKCHACNGRGYFKTSPETRALKKVQASARRAQAQVVAGGRAAQFLTSHPDVQAWFDRNAGSSFARSLREALFKFGKLTPNQLDAIERQIVSYKERLARDAAVQLDPAALDLSSLPPGRYAVPGGDSRLKILVRKPTQGKWMGWTFVSDAAEYGYRNDYGRQKPGGRYAGKIEQELHIVLADPLAASVAYGKLVGSCGVCGRILEDADSIAAGIGPVCASRFK